MALFIFSVLLKKFNILLQDRAQRNAPSSCPFFSSLLIFFRPKQVFCPLVWVAFLYGVCVLVIGCKQHVFGEKALTATIGAGTLEVYGKIHFCAHNTSVFHPPRNVVVIVVVDVCATIFAKTAIYLLETFNQATKSQPQCNCAKKTTVHISSRF